jgi:predicted outer membrane repeat protein
MKLRRTRVALLPLAPAVALVAALAGAAPVHAVGTTITVTGLLDGAGECSDATHCSTIRAALDQASNGDIITLPAGTYTVNTSVGENNSIRVEKAVTIQGAGSSSTIIERACGSLGRLFTIDTDHSTTPVLINDVTITGGHVVGSYGDGDGFSSGGAILLDDGSSVYLNRVVITGNQAAGNGGGVSVDDTGSTITINDSIIKNNAAGSNVTCNATPTIAKTQVQSLVGDGGGVWSDGLVTVSNSSVASNTATGNGGGLLLEPPSGKTDTLTQVFIHDNTAQATGQMPADVGGGGVYVELVSGSHLDVVHSTFSDNSASGGSGGGIYADSHTAHEISVAAKVAVSGPSMNLNASTFNGNTAANNGGGVYVNGGTASLLNDTFNGNSATNGGGIGAGAAAGPNSTLTMENLTVDGNSAKGGRGGGVWLNHDDATLHNTIVSGNTKTTPAGTENCFVSTGSSLTSKGYNLADDTTCHLTQTGDQVPLVAHAALGALQNNGGPATGGTGNISPTLTQLPGTGSTAVDLGDPSVFPPVDERNATRPQGVGPRSDIGAVEIGTVPTPTPTPTPSPTGGTLPTGTASPAGGVQGIISVPSTGGGLDPVSPLGMALLAGLGLLGVSAVMARRRSH